jgi:hypothetical protein
MHMCERVYCVYVCWLYTYIYVYIYIYEISMTVYNILYIFFPNILLDFILISEYSFLSFRLIAYPTFYNGTFISFLITFLYILSFVSRYFHS